MSNINTDMSSPDTEGSHLEEFIPMGGDDFRYVLEQDQKIPLLTLRVTKAFLVITYGFLSIPIFFFFRGDVSVYECIGSMGIIFIGIGTLSYKKKRDQEEIVYNTYVINSTGIDLVKDGETRTVIAFDETVMTAPEVNEVAIFDRTFGPLCGYDFRKGDVYVNVSWRKGYKLADIRGMWPLYLDLIRMHNLKVNDVYEYMKKWPSRK